MAPVSPPEPGPGAGTGSPRRTTSELVRRITSWHGRLRQSAPPGVDPLLRMGSGAALIHGERARRIDEGLPVLLALAGRGLEPSPPGFAGVSLRPKVSLQVSADGAGLRVVVSYYGRVPGVRALGEARAALGEAAYLYVEGGAGRAIRLILVRSEPPRSLSLVMVEAGGREFAVPMHFVSRALPEDGPARAPDGGGGAPGAAVPSMAACLGLASRPSGRGRAARLMMEVGGGERAIAVDAVLGHRRAPVYGTGPLLGVIPWLLGVVQGEQGAPVLVIHPRRVLAANKG